MDRAYAVRAHSYVVKPGSFRSIVARVERVKAKAYWVERNRPPSTVSQKRRLASPKVSPAPFREIYHLVKGVPGSMEAY